MGIVALQPYGSVWGNQLLDNTVIFFCYPELWGVHLHPLQGAFSITYCPTNNRLYIW